MIYLANAFSGQMVPDFDLVPQVLNFIIRVLVSMYSLYLLDKIFTCSLDCHNSLHK